MKVSPDMALLTYLAFLLPFAKCGSHYFFTDNFAVASWIKTDGVIFKGSRLLTGGGMMENVEDCRWLCLKNTACNSFNILPVDDISIFCELTEYFYDDTDQQKEAKIGAYNFSLAGRRPSK
ncbi:uncharacterized protein [Clytia hemisphaerica]|uniref:Apple domain-containing protein n=1 Tax=Clytia hemisphaerica TaxID=252671 RepID=A0A7M5WSF9_9CNID|eukprot:TCONS_00039930-protein